MRKIAVLSSHTPSLFWFRMGMMKHFQSIGYEVVAIGNEPIEKWQGKFAAANIRYLQGNISRNGVNPLQDLRTCYSLFRLLRQERPDKIFTFQAKTIIYGSFAARLLGIREVYPLIAGLGSVFINRGWRSRLIASILSAEYRFALAHCPVVFFQNNDDAGIYKARKLITVDQVRLLHGSGVNIERFQLAPLPVRTGFLCISRLIRDKGVYEYLEACRAIKKQYPQVRCMLVGPYDSNPTALTPEDVNPFIQDGTIEYFGEQSDVRPFLRESSIFVLPSYREGTPKTNLEAMAMGRAVITTDAPGCRETVRNGENGVLIPVKDTASLITKMADMIEHPKQIVEMGKRGRQMAEEIFDVHKVNHSIAVSMKL